MNKEEAINILYTLKNGTATTYYMDNFGECDEAIETVLNLIQKQEKIIRKIAESFKQDDIRSVDEIIEYFKKEVEKECYD